MATKRSAIAKARQFLMECRTLSFKIDRAILFGSTVEGKASENSDIDLALFSESFGDNILKNLDLIGSVNIRYREIEAHTYPSKDLGKKGTWTSEIEKTGIEIKV